MSLVAEIADDIGGGVEAHGAIEEAFGGDVEHALSVGPAHYCEMEAAEAEVGARLALLLGVDEAETDVALSFSVEIEF